MTRGPRFEGRVCLVTGGGRGIGRAIALGLGAEGAAVGVVARTNSQCDAVAEELGAQGLSIHTDVTDAHACEAAVARVEHAFGRLDIVVCAAGVSPVRARAEAHDPATFRHVLDVNLTGAFLTLRAASGSLRERGGAAVLISSVTAVVGSPRLAAYGASKAGLAQLARTLAREWGPDGVRVNALCPGYVRTELTERVLDVERLRDEIVAATPLGRVGTEEDVVAPALFLASDEAAYVNGVALLVDGGMAA